ncbi:MAG: sulfatase [Myxococcota bacterium]
MSTRPESPLVMNLVRRGLLGGLAWGVAVGTVHLAVGVALIVTLNMPPMTWFTAKSILIEAAIAVPLGLLLAPLYAVPRGAWLHPIALTVVWIALERWVAVDPTKLQMWIAPSVIALIVLGGATWAAARWPRAVAAVAVALPIVLVALPIVQYRLGGYEVKPLANSAKPPAGAPDVLFIVMDTVRAKSVSAYGYDRPTTPTFDGLAREGVLFGQATSPATWSLPAHASLFTGHFPSSHAAHDETRFLDDKLPTIAQTMVEKGWETRCFTANPYISDTFGLTRGFQWTDQAWITGAGGRGFSFVYRLIDALGFAAEDKGGGQVVDNLERWMATRPADAPPAFVFVNFLEAHFPFNQLPEQHLHAFTQASDSSLAAASQTAFGVQFGRQLTPEEYDTIRQPILDMYDGGVQYTDALVGQVVDLWRKRGTLDNTVVVVLGDHGEMVGEHGAFGHVSSMYQPDLHVPMMIRYPSRIPAGSRIDQPISTVATFATVMDLVNQAPAKPLQVGSLLPGLTGETVGIPVISERYEEKMLADRFTPGTANGKGPLLMPHGRYRAYRAGNWKLTTDSLAAGPWLFDLGADPDEQQNRAADAPEQLAQLQTELATYEKVLALPPLDGEIGPVARQELSDAECEQLAALGYVDEGCAK